MWHVQASLAVLSSLASEPSSNIESSPTPQPTIDRSVRRRFRPSALEQNTPKKSDKFQMSHDSEKPRKRAPSPGCELLKSPKKSKTGLRSPSTSEPPLYISAAYSPVPLVLDGGAGLNLPSRAPTPSTQQLTTESSLQPKLKCFRISNVPMGWMQARGTIKTLTLRHGSSPIRGVRESTLARKRLTRLLLQPRKTKVLWRIVRCELRLS
jgi:hypothetical protein